MTEHTGLATLFLMMMVGRQRKTGTDVFLLPLWLNSTSNYITNLHCKKNYWIIGGPCPHHIGIMVNLMWMLMIYRCLWEDVNRLGLEVLIGPSARLSSSIYWSSIVDHVNNVSLTVELGIVYVTVALDKFAQMFDYAVSTLHHNVRGSLYSTWMICLFANLKLWTPVLECLTQLIRVITPPKILRMNLHLGASRSY